MAKRFKVWLDSGANCESAYEQIVSTDDLGMTDGEWDDLDEDKKERIMREIAFDNSDWGFRELADGDDGDD